MLLQRHKSILRVWWTINDHMVDSRAAMHSSSGKFFENASVRQSSCRLRAFSMS